MGDFVAIAAFIGVPDAEAALAAAEDALRKAGLVAGTYDNSAGLSSGTRVLRPGPAAASATRYGERLVNSMTNGVEFSGPGYFNVRAVGFADSFVCPACNAQIRRGDDRFEEQLNNVGMAGGCWAEARAGREPKESTAAVCVVCGAASSAERWILDDPVFLADIAVEFYNWPYLQRPGRDSWWYIDVIDILERAVGRPAMLSGYKI